MKSVSTTLPGLLLLSMLLHLATLASLDQPRAAPPGPTDRPMVQARLGSTSSTEKLAPSEIPPHPTRETAPSASLLAPPALTPQPPPPRQDNPEEEEENSGLSRYHEAKELEVRPKILADTIPIDPPELRNEAAGGTLILKLWINANGDVDLVRVESSSLPEIFEESAIQSFKTAKFEPGKKKGIATGAIMQIELNYRPLIKPETTGPVILDQKILNSLPTNSLPQK